MPVFFAAERTRSLDLVEGGIGAPAVRSRAGLRDVAFDVNNLPA